MSIIRRSDPRKKDLLDRHPGILPGMSMTLFIASLSLFIVGRNAESQHTPAPVPDGSGQEIETTQTTQSPQATATTMPEDNFPDEVSDTDVFTLDTSGLERTPSTLYKKFAGSKRPVCDLPPSDVVPMTLAEAKNIVAGIDFVENDMKVLTSVRGKIRNAATLHDAYDVATYYLKSRGVNITFRGIDQGGLISLPNRPVQLNLNHSSVPWASANDTRKKAAVENLVVIFAALPRKVIDAFDGTAFYVPEIIRSQDVAGFTAPFLWPGQKEYAITLELQNFEFSGAWVLLHELLGHENQELACGLNVDDKQIRFIFNSPDVDYKFFSQYSKKSDQEYAAESAPGTLLFGLAADRDPSRGSLADVASRILVTRLEAQTGMTAREIAAWAQVASVIGIHQHPLSQHVTLVPKDTPFVR